MRASRPLEIGQLNAFHLGGSIHSKVVAVVCFSLGDGLVANVSRSACLCGVAGAQLGSSRACAL